MTQGLTLAVFTLLLCSPVFAAKKNLSPNNAKDLPVLSGANLSSPGEGIKQLKPSKKAQNSVLEEEDFREDLKLSINESQEGFEKFPLAPADERSTDLN